MNSKSVSCWIEICPGFNAVNNDGELRNVNASITPGLMTSRFEDQSQQSSYLYVHETCVGSFERADVIQKTKYPDPFSTTQP